MRKDAFSCICETSLDSLPYEKRLGILDTQNFPLAFVGQEHKQYSTMIGWTKLVGVVWSSFANRIEYGYGNLTGLTCLYEYSARSICHLSFVNLHPFNSISFVNVTKDAKGLLFAVCWAGISP